MSGSGIITPPASHHETNGHTIVPSTSSSPSFSRIVTDDDGSFYDRRPVFNTSSIVPPPYLPGGPRSIPGISFRSFALGAAFGLCISISSVLLYIDWTQQNSPPQAPPPSYQSDPDFVTTGTGQDVDATRCGHYGVGYLWRIPFFIATLSIFHYLEFDMTARYNTTDAKISSFLLFNNGWAYTVAHLTAMVECLLRWFWNSAHVPSFLHLPLPPLPYSGAVDCTVTGLHAKSQGAFSFIPSRLFLALGLILVVLGQTLRSLAMKTAGKSFNHIVQSTRKYDHVLVTTGIYSWSRHPSYLGFFWWGLGTQFVLGNYVCFIVYAAVLWKFFAARITHEEERLVSFFGKAYLDYKETTPVLIPFIR